MEIPAFTLQPFTSLWDHLPPAKLTPQPLPMEHFGQNSGMILYRTRLIGHKSGNLSITEPHDYALVFLDGQFIDTVYRDGGQWTVKLPATTSKEPVLEILVEGMGHINFAQYMIDRKGITDRVTLNGMTLMNWETFNLPLDDGAIRAWSAGQGARSGEQESRSGGQESGSGGQESGSGGQESGSGEQESGSGGRVPTRGILFRGSFELDSTADTYLDMSAFKKGYVWVNGHNLGRYWYVGPQRRLYCPAPWLRKGKNEVVVLDLQQTKVASIRGVTELY